MDREKNELWQGTRAMESSLLEVAIKSAGLSVWFCRINPSGELSIEFSEAAMQLLGLSEETFDGTLFSFLKCVDDSDRPVLEKEFARLHGANGGFNSEFLLKEARYNENRWISIHCTRSSESYDTLYCGVLQDTTVRRQTEDSLIQVYERYEFLSKATKDAIWDWDLGKNFLTWNHGVESNFGYKEREVRDAQVWRKERIHQHDYDRISIELENAFFAHHANWQSTYRFKCADGSIRHVYDRAYIIYDKNKAPSRLLGAMQDISDTVHAMDEIRKLSEVASNTDNMVFIMDRYGLIEWVNESFINMFGYRLNEVRGKDPKQFLIGPETDSLVMERMLEGVRIAEAVSDELLLYSKSGKRLWMKFSINPVFDESKKVAHYVFVGSDISNQKEFEQSITAIVRELATLIENTNVPIFGIDRNGYINEWNKVTETITGFSKNEILGKQITTNFLEREFVKSFEDLMGEVLAGRPVSNFQLPIMTRSLDRRILLLGASARIGTNMQSTGIIFVAQDITELAAYRTGLEQKVEERTRELNEALQKEKELLDLKSRFVSIASHEFRTPLSTISLSAGFLERYYSRISEEEAKTKLSGILKQVDHMKMLLDDVLTIGKAEAGKITVLNTPVEMFSWMDQLVNEVKLSTGNSHEIVVSQIGEEAIIHTDEKLMRNIVINLLTNAIKFSPDEKKIELDLALSEKEINLEVRDHGVGIPPDDEKHLFTPFYRAENVSSIKGTGLGLSIVKKAVELLGGKLNMKSELGKGTTFRIILPVKEGLMLS